MQWLGNRLTVLSHSSGLLVRLLQDGSIKNHSPVPAACCPWLCVPRSVLSEYLTHVSLQLGEALCTEPPWSYYSCKSLPGNIASAGSQGAWKCSPHWEKCLLPPCPCFLKETLSAILWNVIEGSLTYRDLLGDMRHVFCGCQSPWTGSVEMCLVGSSSSQHLSFCI